MPFDIGGFVYNTAFIQDYGKGGIVTDGLVLHLDAAYGNSYPKGGTTWYDLSGNSNNAILTNGPTYNSGNGGSIVFDGSNDYVNLNLATGYSYVTIEMWCKRDDTSGAEYFWDARNGGGTWMLSEYNGYDWNWGGVVYFNDSNSYNQWHHFVAVKNNTVSYLYKNGVQKASGGNVDGDLGSNFRIGTRYTNSSFWNGNIAVFRIYNRALSSTEITQNYNVLKRRFGL